MNDANRIQLTPEQITFYRENDYLIIPGVVPHDLLDNAQLVIERWVDSEINSWMAKKFIQSN